MTMKLYMNDPYMHTFQAQILDVIPLENGDYGVLLDQTAFYPEGGGQLSDTGTISERAVTHVEIIQNRILHHMVDPIEKNQMVTCTIDWEKRLKHMQAHLGQHLLSAAFKNEFDAATVGFHMGDDYVTIDLDQKLEIDQIDQAENMANHMIYKNVKVNVLYPDPEDLENLPLRKQPKVSENIRIIEVEGYDHSPCGGTHPKFTGEVGMIKIVNVSNYKSGVRIEFLCGSLALQNFRVKNNLLNEISTTLSVRWYEVKSSVDRLLKESEQNYKTMTELKQKLFQFEVQSLKENGFQKEQYQYLIKTFDAYTPNEVKAISQQLGEELEVVRLFVTEEPGKKTLLIDVPASYSEISAKELLAKVLAITGGRGGGSKTSAQGAPLETTEIENILKSII